jgi:DNA-binding sugar fermentation-stimulating protein
MKTPYVADIISLESQPLALTDWSEMQKNVLSSPTKKLQKLKFDESAKSMREKYHTELAHSPGLDCAGIVVPGSKVYLGESSKSSKTKFSIQLCEELREDGSYTKIGYHPAIAEKFCKVLLDKNLLTAELGDYERFDTQQTFGNSRVDFVLYGKAQEQHKKSAKTKNTITLLEVKNVVGADYPCGQVPVGRSKVGVYERECTTEKPYQRSAIFPHGSKKVDIDVVSDRAIKHVHELTEMHGSTDSNGNLIKCAILFVINRSDCNSFRPCHEADMLFAQVLLRASRRGLNLIAKEIVWENGVAFMGRSLPIEFDNSISVDDINERHLQEVLVYNSENSSKLK